MPIVNMPDINGAFSLTVTTRFDTVIGGTGQTIFDFGDGTRQNDLLLAQISNSASLEFVVFFDGQRYAIVADDVIVAGETAQWTVGVDAAGMMRLSKGESIVAQGQGAVPADVDRDTAQVGASNGADKGPLNGVVSSLEFDGQQFIAGIVEPGTDGDDDLLGGDGADILQGQDGDDLLTGQSGNDSLVGGDGNDTLRGGHGDDTLLGGGGDDEIEGLYGADEIDGGSGNDHVFARDGDDLVYGREGADTLIGGIGDDTMFGGDGNDLLAGSQGDDEIHGGGGNDLVFIGNDEDSDRIFLDDGNDHIDGVSASSAFYAEGGEGNDLISSGVGNDTVLGDAGNDTISSNGGNDTLTGGLGDDTLDGGTGIDTAVFDGPQSAFTLTLSPDRVTITDRQSVGQDTDTLTSIEFLDFDQNIDLFGDNPMDLDIFSGPAGLSAAEFGAIIELYIAYFNRAPDALGLLYWGTRYAEGHPLSEMANDFFNQDETKATYASVLDASFQLDTTDPAKVGAFVNEVYSNVLGRTPDQPGYNYWTGELTNNENITPANFILSIIGGAKFPSNPTPQTDVDQAYLATKSDLGAYFSVIKGMSDLDDAAQSMALFDGSLASRDATLAAMDAHYADALDPETGDFLMQLVGVIDDPFEVV